MKWQNVGFRTKLAGQWVRVLFPLSIYSFKITSVPGYVPSQQVPSYIQHSPYCTFSLCICITLCNLSYIYKFIRACTLLLVIFLSLHTNIYSLSTCNLKFNHTFYIYSPLYSTFKLILCTATHSCKYSLSVFKLTYCLISVLFNSSGMHPSIQSHRKLIINLLTTIGHTISLYCIY